MEVIMAAGLGVKERFLRRRLGLDPLERVHPRLLQILPEGHGLMIYEDDALRLIRALTGLEAAPADFLRKRIAKHQTEDEARRLRAEFLARDWQAANVPWGGGWRYKGYPYVEGSPWRVWYNHLLPPNKPCWVPQESNPNNTFWSIIVPASSYHSGGANVCMADGSVRFVTDGVDMDAWMAAGSRNGGETFNLD